MVKFVRPRDENKVIEDGFVGGTEEYNFGEIESDEGLWEPKTVEIDGWSGVQ